MGKFGDGVPPIEALEELRGVSSEGGVGSVGDGVEEGGGGGPPTFKLCEQGPADGGRRIVEQAEKSGGRGRWEGCYFHRTERRNIFLRAQQGKGWWS
ncbi:MAG: hypothetical protein RL077_4254 [Verrucomicrobiota bacterium]